MRPLATFSLMRGQLTFAFAEKAILTFYYENECWSSAFLEKINDSDPRHFQSHSKIKWEKAIAPRARVEYAVTWRGIARIAPSARNLTSRTGYIAIIFGARFARIDRLRRVYGVGRFLLVDFCFGYPISPHHRLTADPLAVLV
jgi:hypothetical protein